MNTSRSKSLCTTVWVAGLAATVSTDHDDAAGFCVDIIPKATWATMTVVQFRQYDVLWIGADACGGSSANDFNQAIASRPTWELAKRPVALIRRKFKNAGVIIPRELRARPVTERIARVLIAILLSSDHSLAADKSSVTVLAHANVIDVVAGKLREDMAIVITGDMISAVSSMAAAKLPESAELVDASQQFAIPGLWDMHIHWYGRDSMQLFPINGVTGVRVMWGNFQHHTWRRAFELGQRMGPHMLIASAIIDGPEPIWPGSIVAEDAEGGRQAVAAAIRNGADFAKVYSLLPREAYFALAEEAKRHGLPFDGHVPMMVSAREASEAGQRCMEHLYEIILACSSEEVQLRQMLVALVEQEGKMRALRGSQVRRDVNRRALATYDPEKASELFEALRDNNTWQCPTLTVIRNLAYLTEPEIQNNPHLKYMPSSMMPFLAPKQDRFGDDAEERAFARAVLERKYKLLAAMHGAGVKVLAGTDVLNPFCLPGFSLHGELQLMVKAGLTPIEALRTATINPAIFQGKEDSLGSIDAGKLADIVLLTDNPLQDISNTTKIDMVILRGKRFTRGMLDEMLSECGDD